MAGLQSHVALYVHQRGGSRKYVGARAHERASERAHRRESGRSLAAKMLRRVPLWHSFAAPPCFLRPFRLSVRFASVLNACPRLTLMPARRPIAPIANLGRVKSLKTLLFDVRPIRGRFAASSGKKEMTILFARQARDARFIQQRIFFYRHEGGGRGGRGLIIPSLSSCVFRCLRNLFHRCGPSLLSRYL